MHQELGKEIAERLMSVPHKQRSAIVDSYAKTYGISRTKVYRIAKQYGYTSGRKSRKDKGVIKTGLTLEDLKLVAGMQKCTKRKNKNMLMPTTVALELFNDVRKVEGKGAVEISPSTVNRHLRTNGMSRKDMLRNWTTDDHKTPAFCFPMMAEHCNEWHVFDITPCIQYYFKPKKGMAQHDLNLELYHGKLDNYKKIGKHLHRYVLIDFKSQVYFFKYYNAHGENLADLLDFLYSAWSFKEGFPFCGVPFGLYADKGAANKSHFLRSVADRLGIKLEHHKRGNSRAKGIVEERMKYIQEHFECRTVFKHATSEDEINTWSYEFCIKDNSVAVHTRKGSTRLALWTSLIQPEQKRILDCSRETFMSLATSKPVPAKVTAYKTIRFNGEEYLLSGPVNRDEWIMVDYNFLDKNNIRVWKANGSNGSSGLNGLNQVFLRATLIRRNRYGEREDAVHIGKEYKRHEDTPVQTAMKSMDDIDYSKVSAAAFGHDLEKVPEKIGYIERTGIPVEIVANVGAGLKPAPTKPALKPVEAGLTGAGLKPAPTSNSPLPKGDQGGCSFSADEQRGLRNKTVETQNLASVLYPRGDVFFEIRSRLKLDRITPIQSQAIEKLLGDKEKVEDAMIEEIIREVFKKDLVQTEKTVQTDQAATA